MLLYIKKKNELQEDELHKRKEGWCVYEINNGMLSSKKKKKEKIHK